MVSKRWAKVLACVAAWGWIFSQDANALSLRELQDDPAMTPKRFAALFKDFRYEWHSEVQEPESFLATKSGDCDDYATLAAEVLGRKGYTTKLVSVWTTGKIHVVCHVQEAKGYLDYNNRACLIKIEPCGAELTDIAKKVAKSLEVQWTAVSEFRFEDGSKYLIKTITNPARSARNSGLAAVGQ